MTPDAGTFAGPARMGYLFRRAEQVHVAAWQRHVSSEITTVQWGVIATLHRLPGLSQQELGRELGHDRSTMAAVLTRLEQRGLAQRRSDSVDRRIKRLELTDDGRRIFDELSDRVIDVELMMLAGLTDGEQESLRSLITKFLVTTQA